MARSLSRFLRLQRSKSFLQDAHRAILVPESQHMFERLYVLLRFRSSDSLVFCTKCSGTRRYHKVRMFLMSLSSVSSSFLARTRTALFPVKTQASATSYQISHEATGTVRIGGPALDEPRIERDSAFQPESAGGEA